MQYEPGHIYMVSPFRFKNGSGEKTKFFIPLHVSPDGAVTGTLVTSREKGRVPTGSVPGKAMVYDNGNIAGFFLPYGEGVTDSGFAFRVPTFSFYHEVARYSAAEMEEITAAADRIVDHGALEEKLFADITSSLAASGAVREEVRAEMARTSDPERTLRRLSRTDRDRLSEIGVTARNITLLQRDGVLVHENRNLDGGRAIIVLGENGLVTALAADGTKIGTLRELAARIRQGTQGHAENVKYVKYADNVNDMASKTQAPEQRRGDRYPPGTLRPYLQKESAIKWLADHMAGETAIDRKTMYHLNIIDSLIQHEKEILKRIPSDYVRGLPEGGRRHVAASALLRAEACAGGEKPETVLPSGYTVGQEAVGNWAERDGCWEDYAEEAQRRQGRRQMTFGSEARVFADDDGYVYKTIDISHYGSLEKLLDRISLHNAVFPETAMTVMGFGTRDDAETLEDYVVTVRQPFVQGTAHDSPELDVEVRSQMEKRDFTLVQPAEAEGRGDGEAPRPWCLTSKDRSVLLYDLHDQNLVFDAKGNMLVFDCEIRLNDSPRLGGPYRVPEVEYDAEAVRRIDAFVDGLVPQVRRRADFEAMYSTEGNALREQLAATGRYDGIISGAFPEDRWLVQVNPENSGEVLILPQRNATLMISILPEGELTREQAELLAQGRGYYDRENRYVAFNLDKGRADTAKSYLRIRKTQAEEARRTADVKAGQEIRRPKL